MLIKISVGFHILLVLHCEVVKVEKLFSEMKISGASPGCAQAQTYYFGS